MTLLGWWETWPYRNGSHNMGFSLILILFICPSFYQSRMIKFSSFQTHFDPFAGEDNIRKAGRCVTHHFHSRILVMCLPLRLSSPFPSLGVPLGLPDPSTFGRILWKIRAPPLFCTYSVIASYPKPLYWHCLTKATIRSFQAWAREGSKLVYQVTATPSKTSLEGMYKQFLIFCVCPHLPTIHL